MSRIAILGMAVVCLSGCVPMFGHYYEPALSVPEARVERHDCHGGVGPSDAIRLTYGTVIISVWENIAYPSSGKNSLGLDFVLPEGKQVSAPWEQMQAFDPSGRRVSLVPVILGYQTGLSSDQKLTDVPLDMPMIGKDSIGSVNGHETKTTTAYEVKVDLDSLDSESFTLHMPAITVDGKTYPAFDVTYQRRFGFWVDFINC